MKSLPMTNKNDETQPIKPWPHPTSKLGGHYGTLEWIGASALA